MTNIRQTIQNIRKGIENAFAKGEAYSQKFQPFKQMIVENTKLDMNSIKETEPDIDFFHDSLAMYHAQISATNEIEDEIEVGIIQIKADTLKETFLPSPQGCLEKIEEYLPILANAKNENLLSVINSAAKQVSNKPESVEEFVESLSFLEHLNSQIPVITDKFNKITRLYSLIEEYKISVPAEEFALYQTLVPSFSHLKAGLAYCEARKEDRISHYTSELEENINKLKGDISVVKTKIEDPMYIDISSYAVDSIASLKRFRIMLEQMQKQSLLYTSYQGHFQLPYTEYPELAEAMESLETRELLWTAVLEWDEQITLWHCLALNEVDLSEIEQEIKRFGSVIDNIELSLPNLAVSDKLRDKIAELNRKSSGHCCLGRQNTEN